MLCRLVKNFLKRSRDSVGIFFVYVIEMVLTIVCGGGKIIHGSTKISRGGKYEVLR